MSDYTVKTMKLTEDIKSKVGKMSEWIKEDYADRKEKIGKVEVEYEFEEYQAMKCEVLSNGTKRWTPDPNGEITYELIVTFKVPLRGMSFEATDHHQYRWNERRKELEHESTDVY